MRSGAGRRLMIGSGYIKNADSIIGKLRGKTDGVSNFLNEQMGSNFKDFVATYKPSKESSKKQVPLLVELLNNVISGPSIFDTQRFYGIKLKPDSIDLLAKNPQGSDLIRLNQMLLEDAYPEDLWKGTDWQPNAELCHPCHDYKISRYELIHDIQFAAIAAQIVDHIKWVSPSTEVRKHAVQDFKDPWDFEQVYLSLQDWASTFKFDIDSERYYVHMDRGSFVQHICLFLLVESKQIPADLIYNSPPEASMPHGKARSVDLSLSKYDKIAVRFESRREDAVSELKNGIETRNAAFNQLINEIEHVAVNTTKPILLLGPTGAGKSDLAKRIYELRKARGLVTGQFVAVNCATIRGDGAMSALFGHVRGAFTGAAASRKGFVLAAHKGLLFLDEIGDLGIEEQTLLLRALETKKFPPCGSETDVESDFQLITATNRDVHATGQNNGFRADLLARIDLWSYELPSLRDRLEDIEPNLDYELKYWVRDSGKHVRMSKEVRGKFLRFAMSPEAKWTANFRDLRGMVTRMATLSENGIITPRVLEAQINHFKKKWAHGEAPDTYDAILLPLLGEVRLAGLDIFDKIQLAPVIQICRKSKSAAEAGRKLYTAASHANTNHSDRVKKYLERFGLSFTDCINAPSS